MTTNRQTDKQTDLVTSSLLELLIAAKKSYQLLSLFLWCSQPAGAEVRCHYASYGRDGKKYQIHFCIIFSCIGSSINERVTTLLTGGSHKISMVFQESVKGVWSLKGVSWKFQGYFKEVLRVLTENFKEVSMKVKGCFKEVSRMFSGSLKCVYRKFQRWFKEF